MYAMAFFQSIHEFFTGAYMSFDEQSISMIAVHQTLEFLRIRAAQIMVHNSSPSPQRVPCAPHHQPTSPANTRSSPPSTSPPHAPHQITPSQFCNTRIATQAPPKALQHVTQPAAVFTRQYSVNHAGNGALRLLRCACR